MRVVVGVDAGGSSTRALAVTADGTVVGERRTGGGNHRSAGTEVSRHFREAVAGALGDVPTAQVAAVVAGVAGAAAAAGDTVRKRVADDLAALGIGAPHAVVTDLDIAFLGGAPGDDGLLLLSGTGAVAARYAGRRLEARCDGMGWRLGDEGSGWWIGSRALRAAAAALDGRGAPTALVQRIGTALGVQELSGDLRQDWIRTVAPLTAGQVAALVPAVVATADAGDALAATILAEAAEALLGTCAVVSTGPADVVLVGGVLTGVDAVRQPVTQALRSLGHRVHLGERPVLGALRLAAELAGWRPDLAR
ncbi:N-acetylglucosamine kinase [Desertihabitans aurantiacus]|uniref:N-acetylglucosamine kinase n=1 Tax=Desertihabitans aurantiacus TaxID=2282477 RepID=UPI000DF77ABE|nr:BadF/BadG/BcrA/BcrD ATPase family protein [Desertihabitans aurantiacus]